MVEAPKKIWATFEPHESGKGHLRTYATATKTKGQEYLRSDIAERQIAELRAERDKANTWAKEQHAEADRYAARVAAAEAENARLRALPLKDEVERVLERCTHLLSAAGKAIEEDGWGMDFTHVDGISTDHIGFSTDCENAVSNARALLSRLRAGEQERYWREIETNFQIKGRRRSPAYFPATGEECEVSGPNCDDAAGYTWMTATVLWRDELFVLYGRPGFWPNLHKHEHVLFRPLPAAPSEQGGGRDANR